MEGKAYAVLCGGAIHTLRPAQWPKGDHRAAWKWQAFVEGNHWRLFKTVGDWERAVATYGERRHLGPNGESTLRAVAWSEHEGRVVLDRLADQAR